MKQNLLNMKYNANLFSEWAESLEIHSSTDQMYLNTIIPLLMMASRIETRSQITKNQTLLEVCSHRQDMGPWVDKSQSQVHPQ